jgi:hypothetical protein
MASMSQDPPNILEQLHQIVRVRALEREFRFTGIDTKGVAYALYALIDNRRAEVDDTARGILVELDLILGRHGPYPGIALLPIELSWLEKAARSEHDQQFVENAKNAVALTFSSDPLDALSALLRAAFDASRSATTSDTAGLAPSRFEREVLALLDPARAAQTGRAIDAATDHLNHLLDILGPPPEPTETSSPQPDPVLPPGAR